MRPQYLPAVIAALVLSACTEMSKLPSGADIGPNPTLPEPNSTLIPTVKIAPAKGWPAGLTPKAAPGTRVAAFATGLQHPRWVYVLPNGDVLVAEASAPERPEEGKGIKGRIMASYMNKAGAAVPSANRITLLRDADGDGVPEGRHVFLEGLNSPFGMALVGDDFYVANTDAIVRFPYQPGQTRISAPGTKLVDLPAGPRNHHWTKNLIASRDGTKLYVTTGSNSNVAEYGMAEEAGRGGGWGGGAQRGGERPFSPGV